MTPRDMCMSMDQRGLRAVAMATNGITSALAMPRATQIRTQSTQHHGIRIHEQIECEHPRQADAQWPYGPPCLRTRAPKQLFDDDQSDDRQRQMRPEAPIANKRVRRRGELRRSGQDQAGEQRRHRGQYEPLRQGSRRRKRADVVGGASQHAGSKSEPHRVADHVTHRGGYPGAGGGPQGDGHTAHCPNGTGDYRAQEQSGARAFPPSERQAHREQHEAHGCNAVAPESSGGERVVSQEVAASRAATNRVDIAPKPRRGVSGDWCRGRNCRGRAVLALAPAAGAHPPGPGPR